MHREQVQFACCRGQIHDALPHAVETHFPDSSFFAIASSLQRGILQLQGE